MPGRNLSNLERDLLRFWSDPPRDFVYPLLKGVGIEGPPSLRGIERISVPFDYPVTALCGRNGVGKSTILGLVAFSANRPNDWLVAPWPTAPTRKQPKKTAYSWSDFFFRHNNLPSLSGLKVTFTYLVNGDEIQIVRQLSDGRWRTLADPGRSRPPAFPVRPIEFVSLARIIPPSELHYVRKHFQTTPNTQPVQLSQQMCELMTNIFGYRYENVSTYEAGGVTLASCTNNATEYNGFDMGSGENAVITILSCLQRMPAGGLLIIEEAEHGLHGEARYKLVDALTDIANRRKQQIIFTTHSTEMIDRLPRQGRVLVRREGEEHKIITEPTTRFATFEMSGVVQPEGMVFVEDNFAAALVSRCLSRDLRLRVKVIPIGDKSRVASQLGAHIRGNVLGSAKCVFDGDCTDAEIRGWMRREELPENASNYVKLPGDGEPPERWVIESIREEPYLSEFSSRLSITTQDALAELNRLRTLPEHHNIPYELARNMGLSETEATNELVAVIHNHPQFAPIRNMVFEMLN